MRAELEDAVARRTAAEDEARYWRGKAESWEAAYTKAVQEKDTTHRVLVDWCAVRLTGIPIFGTAPALPREFPVDQKQPKPVGKRLARDVVNEVSAKFDAELNAYIQQQYNMTQ